MPFLTSSSQLFFSFCILVDFFCFPFCNSLCLLVESRQHLPLTILTVTIRKLLLTLPNKNSREPGFCNFPEQGSALSRLRDSLLACQMTSPLHFKSSHHISHRSLSLHVFWGKNTYMMELSCVLNLPRSPMAFG